MMLNHYSLLLKIARVRQQEMLQQAKADRLYRLNRSNLLQQIGCWLASNVRQLKIHSQLNTATPILGQK
jgi:hypothetical protein